jgi:acyl-CoA synthetase (AMP-forming)/AMP-acid ligase II/1-acyl-sn-glycerol-3-phosphate acyltransferase/acyl carrier protein
MKRVLESIIFFMAHVVLWFRYRIKVKGLENLTPEALNKPGGVLFLPNHASVFVDPLAVGLVLWRRFRLRPLIVEYMYYLPIVNRVMKYMKAIPVPSFNISSNSFKRLRSDKVMHEVIKDLAKGDNFLIYPAGKVKLTPQEVIGGASGVHQIIQAVPEANIVLVRVKGLWGSIFSAYPGSPPGNLMDPLMFGIKCCLKNLLFFTPRREITIELVPAGKDFPYNGSKSELNRYLEDWYNQPDGLSPQIGTHPGDSLSLVSYSMWGEKYLTPQARTEEESLIDLENIPQATVERVKLKLSEMTDRPASSITAHQGLARDLGLDSLDIAEISAFLHDTFDVKSIPVRKLTTVATVLGFASGQLVPPPAEETATIDMSRWYAPVPRTALTVASGKTIPEVFLNTCRRMGNQIACGDQRAGICTYNQLKMRALLLAEHFRTFEGKYIGVLLPAGVAANIVIMALLLAGKTPLMINWTVGPRLLESVISLSHVKTVISAWAFLDKLDNVELDGLETRLIMLEDIRHSLGLAAKAKALMRSKLPTGMLLKIFNISTLPAESEAVLLFTSGTESSPKGVPLSHENILYQLKAIFQAFDLYSDDILLGILPPFHAFGFTISTLLPLLSGMRLASYPNPTDGAKVAENVDLWKATLICGAPTFLRTMLKAATPSQLQSLRLAITGAEKATPDLFQHFQEIGKPNILLEGYGITECAPVLTFNRPNMPMRGVGQPIPGVELCVVHPETFDVLPSGAQGLVLAYGPNVFKGYLNPDVAAPFVIVNNKRWYKTGDLGIIDAEGYLTLAGRQKRFIKIGAELISLASIEEALSDELSKKNSSDMLEGPTIAVAAQEWDAQKSKIYLFTNLAIDTEEANLLLKKAGFSSLVRFSSTIHVEEIPILGSGKVNYQALNRQLLNRDFDG